MVEIAFDHFPGHLDTYAQHGFRHLNVLTMKEGFSIFREVERDQ